MRIRSLRKNSRITDKEIEFYEKRFDDANRFFKHTLTAISTVIVFATILVSVLAIVSSSRVDSAIDRMEKRFNELANKIPSIDVLFNGNTLNNQVIEIASIDSVFILPKIEFYNNGNGGSTFPSITLFFSKKVQLLTRNIWLEDETEDEIYRNRFEMNTSANYTPDLRVIFPGETDYLPEFKFVKPQNIKELKVKIVINYENTPIVSRFSLSFNKEK